MGEIVGAAIVSHHPGLMQPLETRLQRGGGHDSDLVQGFERVRARMDAVEPDTMVIFDTHWFTTGMHLVTGAARYWGAFTSSELPFAVENVPYDYDGAPELAAAVETVAQERGIPARSVTNPNLPLYYGTINVVRKLRRTERVMSVGSCQNAAPHHFLAMGEAIAEAIERSDCRVVLLASGALSHAFHDLDYKPSDPRHWSPANVFSEENRRLDGEVIEQFRQGRHEAVIDRYPELRRARIEGFGAHYLQMVGALGGRACTAKGTPLSEYENAAGTGNIHIWFELEPAGEAHRGQAA